MRSPHQHRLARALRLALCVAALTSCQNKAPRHEPPLRALLHTENGQTEATAPAGWEEWLDRDTDPHNFPGYHPERAHGEAQSFELTTPEGVIYAAYDALIRADVRALQALALDSEGLATLARVPNNRSEERALELQNALQSLVRGFHPDSPTDARPDGLSGLIQPAVLTLGPPRTVDGKIAESPEAATMISGSVLRIHILSSTIDFDIRIPRLLKDPDGRWWISDALSVSDTWAAFRRPGLDLKTELLLSQHASFPFDVGNFWHYDVKVIPQDGITKAEDVQPTRALGYRDTVSSIYSSGNYLVATIRRTFADPARPEQTRNLLVTPRHIYPCSTECYRRRTNLTFLLGYMGRTTPLQIQPAMRTQSWREGGRSDTRGGSGRTIRIAELSTEPFVVPAGAFARSVQIRWADGGSGPTVTFTDGVGILREEYREGGSIYQANLVQYRIFR